MALSAGGSDERLVQAQRGQPQADGPLEVDREQSKDLASMLAHTAPLSLQFFKNLSQDDRLKKKWQRIYLTTYSLKTPADTSAHPLESYAA